MPPLALLPRTVRRALGGLPELPIKNLIAEEAITEPSQFVLLGRPCLSDGIFSTTRGSGPIEALFYADGVLSGATCVLSGNALYVNSTNKGTVPGTGYGSIAGNEIGIIATRGDDAKFVDAGGTFRSITFPDSAKVTKVLEQGGRFIFLRAGSQRYYWTKPYAEMIVASNIVIDGAAYASSENEPDLIRDAIIFRGYLALGGAQTIEMHAYVGDANLPWQPQVGSVINKGVYATGCMTTWNRTFAWLGSDGVVYRYDGSGEQRISDNGIEDILRTSTVDIFMDSFTVSGHEFLRIKGPADGDLLLDAQTMLWAQWSTDDGPFLGGPTVFTGVFTFFGSTVDGDIYPITYDTALDADLPADKIFRAGIAVDGGAETMHNLLLRCRVGANDYSTIQMRFSRDKGNTWTSWIDGTLGGAGDYRTKVEWRSLGMIDQPGFLAEFKIPGTDTSDDSFSVSGAYYNEFVQGRGR